MRFRKSFWGFSLMWQCNTIYNYIFNQWFLCNYLALVSIFSNFFEVHVFNCLSLFSWTCQDNKKRITVHEDTPPGLLSDEEEPDGAIGWVSHFYSRDLTSGPMRVSGLLLIIDYILAIESRQQLFKFCPIIIKNLWPVRLNLKLSLMNTWSLHIKWRIQILWIWVFFFNRDDLVEVQVSSVESDRKIEEPDSKTSRWVLVLQGISYSMSMKPTVYIFVRPRQTEVKLWIAECWPTYNNVDLWTLGYWYLVSLSSLVLGKLFTHSQTSKHICIYYWLRQIIYIYRHI